VAPPAIVDGTALADLTVTSIAKALPISGPAGARDLTNA
jgi:hypothetical protein